MKIITLISCIILYCFRFQNSAQAQGRGEDPTFITGTGFNGVVTQIVLQSDEKILVRGDFTEYNGRPANRIIRLNADGSRDESFQIGTGFNKTVYKIVLQPDGKIVVGGDFTEYNGVSANRIIRLNADGSRDSNFQIGTGFDDLVNYIALQSDGKILASGNFISYNGIVYSKPVLRLNADGTIDSSFQVDLSEFDRGYSVSYVGVLSSGKIILAGSFIKLVTYISIGSTINSLSIKVCIGLNANGTLDKNYQGYTYISSLADAGSIRMDHTAIYLTKNDEIRIGLLTRYSYISSLYSSYKFLDEKGREYDSKLDAIFIAGEINDFLIDSDESLFFAGGGFCRGNVFFNNLTRKNECDGQEYKNIVKFNADRSLNKNFNVGKLFNGNFFVVAVQSDGKILVGGDFTSYDGFPRNRIVRLINGFAPLKADEIQISPNPTSDYLNLMANPNSIWQIMDTFGNVLMAGRIEKSNAQIDIRGITQGIYILHLTDPQGNKATKRIVKY
ncbi:hypothetical protein AD998_15670 [bacterium 336/3]|nr:hypothetical protein AD998_15670 [bacterium 336/3]